MPEYILISESALDTALVSGDFSEDTMLPNCGHGVYSVNLSERTVGYRVASEPDLPYFAMIGTRWLKRLVDEGGNIRESYRRIARVVKGLSSPPVHLPRQWAEYHFRNLLAFFALPRDVSSIRWIIDIGSMDRCARFDFLTTTEAEIDLASFSPSEWPLSLGAKIRSLLAAEIQKKDDRAADFLAKEVDLSVIGSSSIVSDRTYEEWKRCLSQRQADILENPIDKSIRIVGPAGSGKTLSLCMRALQVANDKEVIAQGRRVVIATHSWAMSERIDGVIRTLNGGMSHEGATVFPLLSLLELHAGHIGQRKTEVIGNDSTDGRLKSLEILTGIVSKLIKESFPNISGWISQALAAENESRSRVDLVINLYEEISGILTALGVASDDPESIQDYINGKREDWMPPFVLATDRGFVVSVYKQFIQNLIDRGAITTDQFIIDSIRVLETFTWRMRKETEGYDYIFVDELQLFDPQERSALQLLGRFRKGVPFITAEDPSQGVFSALNTRKPTIDNVPVYLDTVHRFNREIFDFISFVYQQFPLNALPLKIEDGRASGKSKPLLISCLDDQSAISESVRMAVQINTDSTPAERICLVTLGDVDMELTTQLFGQKLQVTRLASFDDVEKLAYQKRSVVVSPWQFIGGTQFAHVVVLAIDIDEPASQFGRLREMIAVYLSCSRAAESLNVICSSYVPKILADAAEHGLLIRRSAV